MQPIANLAMDHTLLDWIKQRVWETQERGSIYITIEKGQIASINHEKNSKFPPSPRVVSSDDPKRSSSSGS